jgi:hypothetical protein
VIDFFVANAGWLLSGLLLRLLEAYLKRVKKIKTVGLRRFIKGASYAVLLVIGLQVLDGLTKGSVSRTIYTPASKALSACSSWLIARSDLSRLGVIGLLVGLPVLAVAIFLLVVLASNRIKGPAASRFDRLSYTEDFFGGVLYRWEYLEMDSRHYSIENLTRFCARCRCVYVHGQCPKCSEFAPMPSRSDEEIKALISSNIEEGYRSGCVPDSTRR